jgi:spermidine synthase
MDSNRSKLQDYSAMNGVANELLVLAGITHDRGTVFKFCEPADAARDPVLRRLFDGSYKKAFLIEEPEYRSLCFALDGCTQSEMRIKNPDALVNEYTREMMGFLAFQPSPKGILIVGLGGGSLVKFCHRYLPPTRIIAVEIDPVVLSLRSEFMVPPDDGRLSVILADGAGHIADMVARGEQTDAILVDAYDHTGIAPAVVTPSFVENTARILGAEGIFVMNLVAESDDANRHIETIRRVFADTIVVAMRRCGNLVVFAGQTLQNPRRAGEAMRNAERVESKLGLFFPTLLENLKRFADQYPLMDAKRTSAITQG